jgi:hypothetical protein
MLGKAGDTEQDEGTKEKIYQGIISYRKITRQLPEETRAALDRKIAAYSNSQVKRSPQNGSRETLNKVSLSTGI